MGKLSFSFRVNYPFYYPFYIKEILIEAVHILKNTFPFTCVNLLCLRDTLWFFGLTESLCLAAVLSKRGTDWGTASRLMDSIVPGGGGRLERGDLTGVLCWTLSWLTA